MPEDEQPRGHGCCEGLGGGVLLTHVLCYIDWDHAGSFGASPEILDFFFSSNKQACHLARSPHKIAERNLNRF